MNRGIVVGALAGLAGTWAMSEAQRLLWTHVVDGQAPESAGGKHDCAIGRSAANTRIRTSGSLGGRPLRAWARSNQEELRLAAPLMHYLFGGTIGAVCGAWAGHRASPASGAVFGTTVWLAADKIAMPLLGLSDSTARRPLEMHLQSLAAHLVYGTVTEVTPLGAAYVRGAERDAPSRPEGVLQ
jgi:hypothetical protein